MLDFPVEPSFPAPCDGERPAVYADRVGQWYACSMSASHKKRSGQYLTPLEVADFMAALCQPSDSAIRALDPGAGAGVLSCALCEALASHPNRPRQIALEAYETDSVLATYLNVCLEYARQWLEAQGIALTFRVSTEDFVLAHAHILASEPNLFPVEDTKAHFDLVISNPPYFKIPKSDPRAQASASVVHGQPNIYALFMAICASLLKPEGELVFITPRSYASGPYFCSFRQHFFATMRPKALHVFQSRQEAFRSEEVLQENVILHALRVERQAFADPQATVEVSSSRGMQDLPFACKRRVPLTDVLDWCSKDPILHIPIDETDDEATCLVRQWTGSLHAYGLAISTGPVVPFRAVPHLAQTGELPTTHAPLLWMQHVAAMKVEWPLKARGKAHFIRIAADSMRLLVPNRNYVLLRRFSSKEQPRRLIAAPYLANSLRSDYLGLENHLNYVYRPGGSLTAEEAHGLAALFNSALLDAYFRTFNGNTQVSATEIRAMPLPSLDTLTEIGRRFLAFGERKTDVDALIAEVLGRNLPAAATNEAAHV